MANKIEVNVEVIFHATEDPMKVLDPLSDIFQIQKDEFSVEKMVGHYGNQILLFRARLEKTRAGEFVRKLASKISQVQIDEIIDNIDMHFENSYLFLRIGKGDLVSKRISLQQDNAIKIKIKAPIYKKEDIVRTYTELLRA